MMGRGSLRFGALFVSIAPFVVLLLGPSLPQVKSFFPSHVRKSTKLPILENGAHVDTRASRRTFFEYLKVAAISAAGVATTATPTCAKAASPFDAGEAIRRSAANIPGYGQTDVFFPVNLIGTWSLNRQVDFGNDRDPLQLSYPFRFIRSIEDDAVVADRGFNQAELEKAIVRAVTGNNDDTSSSGVRSYEWVQTNPNDLRLVLMDGKRKEIKVTKRATEKTDTTVSSSEFQRITQEDSRGIPNVSARRVVSKWKIADGNTLEGLEIIYDMGGGDPMAASPGTNSKPTVLSKSRILLTR